MSKRVRKPYSAHKFIDCGRRVWNVVQEGEAQRIGWSEIKYVAENWAKALNSAYALGRADAEKERAQ